MVEFYFNYSFPEVWKSLTEDAVRGASARMMPLKSFLQSMRRHGNVNLHLEMQFFCKIPKNVTVASQEVNKEKLCIDLDFATLSLQKKPRQICTPVVLDGTATREVYVCRLSTARMPRKRCQKKRRPLVVVSERAPYSVHFGVRQRQSAWTCYILVEGFLRYRYNHTLKKQPPVGNVSLHTI